MLTKEPYCNVLQIKLILYIYRYVKSDSNVYLHFNDVQIAIFVYLKCLLWRNLGNTFE